MKSEEYFDKPLEFLPERWLNDNPSKINSPYVYLPFGAGVRSCFGQRFAVLGEHHTMITSSFLLLITFLVIRDEGFDGVSRVSLQHAGYSREAFWGR